MNEKITFRQKFAKVLAIVFIAPGLIACSVYGIIQLLFIKAIGGDIPNSFIKKFENPMPWVSLVIWLGIIAYILLYVYPGWLVG